MHPGAPTLVSACVLLVFLHAGALAAPFHHSPSATDVHVVSTVATTTPPPSRDSYSSAVHVDIAPAGPLDIADIGSIQRMSFLSIREVGDALIESLVGFFHRLASRPSPAASHV